MSDAVIACITIASVLGYVVIAGTVHALLDPDGEYMGIWDRDWVAWLWPAGVAIWAARGPFVLPGVLIARIRSWRASRRLPRARTVPRG